MEFKYRIGGKEIQTAKAELTEKGLSLGGVKDVVPGVFFGSVFPHGPNTVKRFSDLVKVNKEPSAVKAIQEEFPQVLGISVAENLGTPALFATISGVPEAKIQLDLVSHGISKFFGILLAIIATPKGVLLVDEIGSGLHYSQLVSIWRRFINTAKESENRVQLFASTHSFECIKALGEAVAETPNDLRILHFKRDNGESSVVKFAGEDALCAIKQGFEVR